MSSSAKDIPSTAYREQGLDPPTVVRNDAAQQASSSDESRKSDHLQNKSSIHGRLFPEATGTDQHVEMTEGLVLGSYTVETRIGAGGMGAVFRARDNELDRTVALKILSPQQAIDPSSIRRFQNEAKSAARLDHDNIARIYAIGEEKNLHFIAFEYVEGVTVRELIRRKGPVDAVDAVNYLLQIAIALKHTAAAGVVHRDIKPSNLIVTPTGRIKLVDWGLARKERLDEQSLDLTVSGTTLGTFDYISPEQARDPRNVDVRSDIYSLGCTAYHMLTGTPPYAEGTVLQKLLDHQGKNAPDPREKNPAVPAELARIVMKMMASAPENRYWSPQPLIEDLLQLAAHSGMRAVHPDGLTWRSDGNRTSNSIPYTMMGVYLGVFLFACVAAIAFDQWSLQQKSAEPASQSAGTVSRPFFPQTLPSVDLSNGNQPSDKLITGSQTFPDDDERFNTLNHLPDDFPSPLTSELTTSGGIFDSVFAQSSADIWNTADNDQKNGLVRVEISKDLTGTESTKVEPSPVMTPPVTPATKRGTFHLVSAKGEDLGYQSDLVTAIEEIDNGGVIEYTGEIALPLEITSRIQIIGKSVTIRGTNAAPIRIRLNTANLSSSSRSREFILISSGGLNLQHVVFDVSIPEPLTSGWSVFMVEGASQLRCWQSTVTIDSSHQTAAAIAQISRNSLQSIDAMNLDAPASPERMVQFEDCILRGATDLVLIDTSDPSSIELSRSMVAIDGTIIRYTGDKTTRAQRDAISLRLARVLALTNDGVIRSDLGLSIPRQPANFRIRAEDSLILAGIPQPMIQIAGGFDVMMLEEMATWYGTHNLLSGWSDLVTVRGSNMTASSPILAELIRTGGSREMPPDLVEQISVINADDWTFDRLIAELRIAISSIDASIDLSTYGPDGKSLPSLPAAPVE
ncbi:MAG: serine/threonine protein kinase [Planctomycetaceae bacterium]|nr:serine/threonine protein kinase [Planctomycetaceae bacterium]